MPDLAEAVGRVELISTDVFDTLLLRNSRSQRSRTVRGEKLFSAMLERHGLRVSPDLLVEARLEAQRLAFRALTVGQGGGEVRLVDIVSRQLKIFGIPQSFVQERIAIEVLIEKESLAANSVLAKTLRAHKQAGGRVVAISDTTLSSDSVAELIRHFHGDGLVDAVYSSADLGLTKREGGLFAAVAQSEQIRPSGWLHVGDDAVADVRVPARQGIAVHHLPRPRYLHYFRSANGAFTEVGRRARRAIGPASVNPLPAPQDARAFGQHIFGAIVTQFCLRIWLYAVEAETERNRKSVLLFCARGGFGIRQAFERVLDRLGLPLDMRRENFLISRLVAARAALLVRSDAAVEELDREFRGSSFADVARALGGRAYELPDEWHKPLVAKQFVNLLFDRSGSEVRADIQTQNELFTRHFRQLVGDADRVILCDTGLYGSTQRLLANGFPDIRLETLQFARSNYKGHGEEHFPKVVGLVVEQNVYSPLNVKSCVLRYWHVIESLFEPTISSVRTFAEDEHGSVEANCGPAGFDAIDPSAGNPLLSGTLSYIDTMPATGGALADVEMAWNRLRRAITRPGKAELQCLEVAGRSVDFGRPDVLRIFVPEKSRAFLTKLKSLKARLWREGAIAREFPVLKYALLPAFGLVQSVRGLLARQH